MNIFFLRCLNFKNARRSLFIDISSINSSFKNLPSDLKVELLLFGDSRLSVIDNNLILKASIKYIITTNRFSVPFLWYCFLSLALNIHIHFFPLASTPSRLFFHCSIWENSEICACAVFSCVLYFLSCLIVINCIVKKRNIIWLTSKWLNTKTFPYKLGKPQNKCNNLLNITI